MKYRKLLLASLCLLSVGLSACDDGLSINLSENQIESQMSGYFPYHKEALMGNLKLDLSQPDLILKEGSNRAELAINSVVTTAGTAWPGKLTFSFGLDYAEDTGTFYLVEPRLEKMAMDGVPAAVTSSFTQYMLPLLQQYLTRVPVYTLKADASTGQNIARRTLKKIAIRDKSLQVTLGVVDPNPK